MADFELGPPVGRSPFEISALIAGLENTPVVCPEVSSKPAFSILSSHLREKYCLFFFELINTIFANHGRGSGQNPRLRRGPPAGKMSSFPAMPCAPPFARLFHLAACQFWSMTRTDKEDPTVHRNFFSICQLDIVNTGQILILSVRQHRPPAISGNQPPRRDYRFICIWTYWPFPMKRVTGGADLQAVVAAFGGRPFSSEKRL